MFNKKSIYLFLLFFFSSDGFNVQSSTFQIRNDRLLGIDLTYALFEVTFDQDIILYEAASCTPVCKELPQDCTPCDYSRKENCGNSQPVNQTYGIERKCVCDKVHDWCEVDDTPNNWNEIDFGKEIGPFVIDDSHPIEFFRFHFDKYCHAFRVKAILIYGEIVITLGYDDLFYGRESGLHQNIFPTFMVCPMEFFFKYGTYGLQIDGTKAQNSKFTIIVETFNLKSQPYYEPKYPEKFENDKFNSFKFEPNVPMGPISLKKFEFAIFRFDVYECTQLMIYRELLNSSINSVGRMGILFSVDFPAATPERYHINVPMSFVASFCPLPDKVPTSIYFTWVNIQIDLIGLFTFSTDSSSWVSKKVSEFVLVDAAKQLEGALDIQCEDQVFSCERGASYWGTSCMMTWTVVPTLETTGLWPRPLYLMERDPSTFTDLPFDSTEIILDKKMTTALLLEYTVGSERVIPYANWKTHLQSNCTMNFRPWAHWSTSDRKILTGKIKSEPKELNCNYDSFLEVSQQIDHLSSQITSSSSFSDSPTVLATRYQVDLQTFTPSWQNCNEFVQSFLKVIQKEVVVENTTDCDATLAQESPDDTCCHQSLSWKQCCIPRRISFIKDTFEVPSSIQPSESCQNTDCLNSLLNDYVFYEDLRDSNGGCATAITEPLGVKQHNSLEFYRQCKEDIFGLDGMGKFCTNDEHCLFSCDIFNQTCVFQNQSQLEKAHFLFFQCVSKSMPRSIQEHFINKYNLSGSLSQNEFTLFLNRTFRYQDCATWIGRSILSNGHTNGPLSTTNCLGCSYYCFDESCVPPLRCEVNKQYGRPENSCANLKLYTRTSRNLCEDTFVCSWDPSIKSEEQCLNISSLYQSDEFGCFVCETPTDCLEIPNLGKEECESQGVCIQKTKSNVIFGLNENECKQNFGFCSLDCENCHTKSGCLEYGFCSDYDYVQYLKDSMELSGSEVVVAYRGFVPSDEGVCLKKLNAWNDPDCSIDLLTDPFPMPTPVGCVVVKNETSCKGIDLEWHGLYQSREKCENPTTCFESFITTSMSTPKELNECLACGGVVESIFKWNQGEWNEARWRKPEWRKRKWLQDARFDWVIDFNSLSSEIMNSVVNVFSLELQTEAHCRLNPVKDVMSRILCLCKDSESEEKCLDSEGSLDIGVGQPCSNQKYSFSAPPSIVSFDENSINEGCSEFHVITLLSSEIKTEPSPSISLSFRPKGKEVYNVKNSKGGYVGKLLGNGVLLEFDTSNVNNFSLCLSFDKAIDIQKYTIYDFGSRTSLEDVSPIGLNIERTSNSDQLCAWVTVSSNLEPSYYPIIRDENWENESSSDSLSVSEKVSYSIMFCIYLIVFIGKIVSEVLEGFKNIPPRRWIGFMMFCAICVRLIYICVLLSNTLSDSEDSLSEFLLIEIPSYFYFMACILAALIWYSVVNQQQATKLRKLLGLRFIFILMIFVLFILAIVISWILVQQDGSYTCQGRVYESADDTKQENIRLVYRLIVGFISLGICTFVFYFGNRMTNVLKKSMTFGESSLQKKTFWVSIVSGISLILQCIFFSVYSSVDPSPEYLFFFIPLELLPAVLIFVLLSSHINKSLSTSSGGIAKSPDVSAQKSSGSASV